MAFIPCIWPGNPYGEGGFDGGQQDKGGKVLIFCSELPVCQSIDKSLSGTVQRLSVQVCMSAAILAATHMPCYGQPCGCEEAC